MGKEGVEAVVCRVIIIAGNLCVCVCVCVCEREGDVRRYEIQLRGSLLLFIFFCDEWHVAKIQKV